MAETPEQEWERLRETVQESILTNYPNPERIGCPGEAVVREVAERRELRKDPPWEHITHCSPCYAEFLRHKAVLRTRRRNRRRLVTTALAGVIAFSGTTWWYLQERQRVDVVAFRLEDSFRGQIGERPRTVPGLRTGKSRVTISLPPNSTAGRYLIQIWPSIEKPPVFGTEIDARQTVSGLQLEFEVELDTAPGDYVLGVRNDHREAWRYVPVVVTQR